MRVCCGSRHIGRRQNLRDTDIHSHLLLRVRYLLLRYTQSPQEKFAPEGGHAQDVGTHPAAGLSSDGYIPAYIVVRSALYVRYSLNSPTEGT
jgi:hypothetical protein